jgi:hypothetical protein
MEYKKFKKIIEDNISIGDDHCIYFYGCNVYKLDAFFIERTFKNNLIYNLSEYHTKLYVKDSLMENIYKIDVKMLHDEMISILRDKNLSNVLN